MYVQVKEIMEDITDERQHIVELVRRWGGSASDAVLDPSCKVFQAAGIKGIIAYRDQPGCSIVLGDPVCRPTDLPSLTQAFHHYCSSQSKSIIYLTATEPFTTWAMQHDCRCSIQFGEELVIDPHDDPTKKPGIYGSLVRRKVKQALREGITINEYTMRDLQLEKAIEEVGSCWLRNRHGPQIYTSHVRLFDDRFGKRWFYAKQDNCVVGVLLLNQLQARQGWLLNHVMITPHAPHGTPEILITSALEALCQEGCHFVTFGAVPTKQLGEIVGLGKCSTWISHFMFQMARKIFYLDGRRKFWEKYHPQSEPAYLLFSKPSIGLKEIKALIRALNVSL